MHDRRPHRRVMKLEPLADKWKAFGFIVKEVDGHSFKQLSEAIDFALAEKSAPVVIIAHTVKGCGVDFMEGDYRWHYGGLDSEKIRESKESLKRHYEKRREGGRKMPGLTFTIIDTASLSTAEVYGKALCELGERHPEIVGLSADLAKSTKIGLFQEKFPERFFNLGIAEQNMFSVSAGMAKAGLVPFVSTFAVFASMRALEQVRTDICYQKLNVKIIVTHAGLSFG